MIIMTNSITQNPSDSARDYLLNIYSEDSANMEAFQEERVATCARPVLQNETIESVMDLHGEGSFQEAAFNQQSYFALMSLSTDKTVGPFAISAADSTLLYKNQKSDASIGDYRLYTGKPH